MSFVSKDIQSHVFEVKYLGLNFYITRYIYFSEQLYSISLIISDLLTIKLCSGSLAC